MRVTLRLRIAAAFAIGMAAVLVATGWLLLVRQRQALIDSLDDSLRARAQLIVPNLEAGKGGLSRVRSRLAASDEAFDQLLDPRGHIVDQIYAPRPVVGPTELARTGGHQLIETTVTGQGQSRLLIEPINRGTGRLYLVVGASESDVQEAIDSLLRVLLVIGPLGILATTAAGWFLAGLALRPVERMRRQAEAISGGDLTRRLHVPDTGDELTRLGTTMNAMLDRVESAVEHERRLVDHASHELRTPLGVARAEVELALGRPRSREELEESLRSVGEEIDRVTRLSEDLLVLARTEEGRVPLRRDSVQLQQVIEQGCAAFLDRAEAQGVDLRVEAADCAVDVDADRLGQAVRNLLDNALRHTPAGGSVRVTAGMRGEDVELAVEDSGRGFPEEMLARAFDPFITAGQADGDRAGTGLGLAIVRAVAQSHGGSAVAENIPGGGARVTIVLPARGVRSPV